MLTVYKHIEEELVSDLTVADATKGSWVNLVNPDPDLPHQYPHGDSYGCAQDSLGYGRTVSRGN